MTPAPKSRKKEPELFFNRELSWLAFNARVLEEAMDVANAPVERLKFATIVAGNLDEFFMVRVAALKHAVDEGDIAPDSAGLTPGQQLAAISPRAHEMVERLYKTLTEDILPTLAANGVRLLPVAELDPGLRALLARHFSDEVQPAVTPLAIDVSRPFPHLSSLSLNVALLLAPADEGDPPRLAVVQVPGRLPRLVRPPGAEGNTYVFLEDVIRAELPALFPGQTLLESTVFRVSRDAEMDLDDEGDGDD
jgi:polyphosphate kinase